MVGLCNETLLRYDPLADKYIMWLAKSARFTSPTVYTVILRSGIKWSNGLPFTNQDVAWNFALGRYPTAFWNDLYLNLKSITAPKVTKKVKVKKVCKTVKKKVKVKGKVKIKKVRKCHWTFKKTKVGRHQGGLHLR